MYISLDVTILPVKYPLTPCKVFPYTYYNPHILTTNTNHLTEEEHVGSFWSGKEGNEVFDKANKLSEGRPQFSFYDGPPFATGLPHYGHILAGTIKDVVTRYAYQTGHHVDRKFGWDCHGLPVELIINNEHGVRCKADVIGGPGPDGKAVENPMTIEGYNNHCRAIVQKYTKEWKQVITRLGRWIDFENGYKTMDKDFMESVWWVFKEVYNKKLPVEGGGEVSAVYPGFRVMPFSTALNTPLSNFEAGNEYDMRTDLAVTVTFPLVEDPDTMLLAWTTTPWTLPSNLGLTVHPDLDYVKIRVVQKGHLFEGKVWIVGEKLVEALFPELTKSKKKKKAKKEEVKKEDLYQQVGSSFKGASLVGTQYQPMFSCFAEHPDYASNTNLFKVVADEYVTDDGGTAIVHCAPGFGEDDFRVGMEKGLIVKGGEVPCPVDDDGRFTSEVGPLLKGKHVKAKEDKVDEFICDLIEAQHRLVRKQPVSHSVALCWRSKTPLISKAVKSWFVRVSNEDNKAKLLANNDDTKWVPDRVRTGRFHDWLKNARDWNISRNRFWGTPIPVWFHEPADGGEMEYLAMGSIAELAEYSGVVVTDLHREFVDKIEFEHPKGSGKVFRRIEEVFDCWFESGSMPYAQKHFPFENKEDFEDGYPADFIAEGLDQTRGWFYTLMVLSTLLTDKPAFKNVIVNGLVQAEDGKKMSKSLKNYPDPLDVVNKYGADALRLYLINSPAVRAMGLQFKEQDVKKTLQKVFLPWYNAFRFFIQNAVRFGSQEGSPEGPSWDMALVQARSSASTNYMDKWALAEAHELIKFVRVEMDDYKLYAVTPLLLGFIDQLTNWYVRLNRNRLKGVGAVAREDTLAALCTMHEVLMVLCKLMAPITPFFTEFLYQRLVPEPKQDEESLHFLMMPEYDPALLNEDVRAAVAAMQNAILLGRLAREQKNISLKMPVQSVRIVHGDPAVLEGLRTLQSYIKDELNVAEIFFSNDTKKYTNSSAVVNGKSAVVDKDGAVVLDARGQPVVLARHLAKQYKSVLDFVKGLSEEQIVDFEKAGTMDLKDTELGLDFVLTTDHVLFSRTYISEDKDATRWHACSGEGMVLALDTHQNEELVAQGQRRELVNRIQKLRKSTGLTFEEKVMVNFQTEASFDVAALRTSLRSEYVFAEPAPVHAVVIGQSEETFEGSSIRVRIQLCKPYVQFESDQDAMVNLMVAQMEGLVVGQSVDLVMDGKSYSKVEGVDFRIAL